MKLIKLSNTHYIIVDDSEIKDGDYVYDSKDKVIRYVKKYLKDDWIKKITHSTQPLSEECRKCNGYCEQCVDIIKPLSLSEIEEAINGYSTYELFKKLDGTCEKGEYEHWLFEQGFNAHKELYSYSRNQVHELMCKAFEAGYKKHDVVEAGLESLDTKVECSWILTKYDSTPKQTEWDIEITPEGKIVLL